MCFRVCQKLKIIFGPLEGEPTIIRIGFSFFGLDFSDQVKQKLLLFSNPVVQQGKKKVSKPVLHSISRASRRYMAEKILDEKFSLYAYKLTFNVLNYVNYIKI